MGKAGRMTVAQENQDLKDELQIVYVVIFTLGYVKPSQWVISPTGRDTAFRAQVVWVRIPHDLLWKWSVV